MEENYGHMEIRLNELLKKKGLSKNKLSHKAEMNWKQHYPLRCICFMQALYGPGVQYRRFACILSARKAITYQAREAVMFF